jgi:hypothetical protein
MLGDDARIDPQWAVDKRGSGLVQIFTGAYGGKVAEAWKDKHVANATLIVAMKNALLELLTMARECSDKRVSLDRGREERRLNSIAYPLTRHAMKERGMLMSGPMVRAILAGTKTQTRRVVKNLPGNVEDFLKPYRIMAGDGHSGFGGYVFSEEYPDEGSEHFPCPYGQPGDRIYVRETWQPVWAEAERPPTGDGPGNGWAIKYPATDGIVEYHDNDTDEITQRCRPSIHMPRWASRIDLDIISVRVERLQDISDADARAEGVPCASDLAWDGIGDDPYESAVNQGHRAAFRKLWDSINGPGAWAINPWVWVYQFKRVKRGDFPVSLPAQSEPTQTKSSPADGADD